MMSAPDHLRRKQAVLGAARSRLIQAYDVANDVVELLQSDIPEFGKQWLPLCGMFAPRTLTEESLLG